MTETEKAVHFHRIFYPETSDLFPTIDHHKNTSEVENYQSPSSHINITEAQGGHSKPVL